MRAETLHRVPASIGIAVGLGAALAPRTLLRLYGVDPDEMTGAGVFGWRLFAGRNLVLGCAGVAGVRSARDAILVIQAADQLVFLHAYRTRSIPRATAALAMATSGVVVLADLAARAGAARGR